MPRPKPAARPSGDAQPVDRPASPASERRPLQQRTRQGRRQWPAPGKPCGLPRRWPKAWRRRRRSSRATLADTADRAKLVRPTPRRAGRKPASSRLSPSPPRLRPGKPAVKTKAAPGSKARLDCPEAGFKEHGATVDCNRLLFDIRELKSLRDKSEKKTAKKQSAKKQVSHDHPSIRGR